MTGGQALARQLVREGAEVVFGVPGVQLDDGVDGLATAAPEVRFVATRHEQAATYMADGYARVTGRPGIAMTVPGPGMLNGLAGIATAYACSSPVLFLVAQIPSQVIGEGRGLLHEIPNQSAILHGMCKWSGLARSPEEIPGLVREAFAKLGSGRPRPVAIELPPDVLAAEADVATVEPAPRTPASLDAGHVAAVAAALAAARRPVIVAGRGVEVSGAGAELRALAERLRAPVATTSNGRGAVDGRHPLAVPPHGMARALAGADVALVVGSRFIARDGSPIRPEHARTVAINVDPHDLGHPRAYDAALRGDAAAALRAVLDALGERTGAEDGTSRAAAVREWCARQLAPLEPQMSWLRALREGIDDGGVLVNDLTQVGFVAEMGYEVRQPNTFLTAGTQGTLGFGFPTALGVKMGDPARTVVALAGDGGFGYALTELATARRNRIGVIVALFVDGAYGNVRRTQKERFDGRIVGSELTNPDFVALARSFGVAARRVERPEELCRAIRERAGADEPTLLEIPQGEVPSPWHLIVGTSK